jgi:hypothetical protein
LIYLDKSVVTFYIFLFQISYFYHNKEKMWFLLVYFSYFEGAG